MVTEQSINQNFKENITELRLNSAKIVALLMLGAGYSWSVWFGWLAQTRLAVTAWAAIGLLLTLPVIAYFLWQHHLNLVTNLLVWGLLTAIAGIFIGYPTPTIATLFALPVIFAGVLVSPPTLLAVALASSTTIFAVTRLTHAPAGQNALSTIIVLMIAAATWLSVHNLYTALGWVWTGYEQARANELEALATQADLRRALKALDEAAYRLRGANRAATLARDRAEDARRLKQQFAQTISHELRTPLNLIVGFTEVMIQSPEYYGQALPPNYLHDLGIVYRNARHLQDLIGDVLDLARIEAAQMNLVLEKINPQDLVRTVTSTVRSLAESHGLYLRAEVQPNLPEIWVDPTRIRQVLFNLINNAVRFTEHGGITIYVTQQGPDVRFAVTDTGVGIAPEDLDRIFEEFEQVDSSTHRSKEGAGLGLAISRQFVTLHKGRMGVKSNLGEGSTFFFTLPADKAPHEPAEGEALLRTIRVGDVKNLDEPILLVITRSPTAATMLTRYVQGLRTVVAPDLDRAREAAQQLIPQMIVIDQASSVLDADQMQTLIRTWNLPQTILVGCPLPGEEMLRQRLDVDGYLVKPVSHQSLWDVLRQFGEEIDRILVVDDDRDFVLLISRLLEDNPVRSYRVTSANTGQEALNLLEHYSPDLILLDMILPDVNGTRIAQQIRAREQTRTTPIIFVSAQDVMDYQEPIPGAITVTRREGLTPSEVIKWIQALAATAVLPKPALEAPQAASAP